ncbi:MAG TPA: hypothetical protein VMG38_16040 [Trebonia sp.]|nr:hypothetical protein [Trebonia sp.]
MSETPATVSGPDVSSYLASKGWQRDGDWRGATIWRLSDQARLLVPDLHPYDDADQLIAEAIAKIAKYEQRPETDVRQEIAEPTTDAQFFRLHPDAPPGFIPLPEGAKAANAILELLKHAALATEQGTNRAHVEGRRTSQVNAFLHQVRLGAAIPGSYILTARSPAEPAGPEQLDFGDDLPRFSGRRVLTNLHAALLAARTAAQQADRPGGDSAPFYETVENGVSANLCWALSELGGEGRDQPFEIGFSWARGIPTRGPTPDVEFSSAMPSILARAGNELAEVARRGAARIAGRITAVIDEQAARGEPPRVRVQGELRKLGKPGTQAHATVLPHRPIWVILHGADFRAALEALGEGWHVEAEGEVTGNLRRLELKATTFRVLH